MAMAAAAWVTWAAWADIDSPKFGGTENQNAAGRNSGRVFFACQQNSSDGWI
jgi:hypothetical protein